MRNNLPLLGIAAGIVIAYLTHPQIQAHAHRGIEASLNPVPCATTIDQTNITGPPVSAGTGAGKTVTISFSVQYECASDGDTCGGVCVLGELMTSPCDDGSYSDTSVGKTASSNADCGQTVVYSNSFVCSGLTRYYAYQLNFYFFPGACQSYSSQLEPNYTIQFLGTAKPPDCTVN